MYISKINDIFKQMKRKGQYYGKINDRDMISYNRSGGYHALTVHYSMSTGRKKIETHDGFSWQGVEDFLRQRFDAEGNRKEG